MSKKVLISIRPEWCQKIIDGSKSIEVRKTRPKLKTPFKCYIYMTAGDYQQQKDGWLTAVIAKNSVYNGSQMVIGEFVCDTFVTDKTYGHDEMFNMAACMSEDAASAYSAGSPLYGWHISDLKIYDKPKPLSDFRVHCGKPYCYEKCPITLSKECNSGRNGGFRELKHPPQSWCYVEVGE